VWMRSEENYIGSGWMAQGSRAVLGSWAELRMIGFAELPITPGFLNDATRCCFGKIADWVEVKSLKWKFIALSRYMFYRDMYMGYQISKHLSIV